MGKSAWLTIKRLLPRCAGQKTENIITVMKNVCLIDFSTLSVRKLPLNIEEGWLYLNMEL